MNYRIELFSILLQFITVKLYPSFAAPPTKKEANCKSKPDLEQTRTENLAGSLGTRNPHSVQQSSVEKHSTVTVHCYVVFTRNLEENQKLNESI
jgi:hypothetical protein